MNATLLSGLSLRKRRMRKQTREEEMKESNGRTSVVGTNSFDAILLRSGKSEKTNRKQTNASVVFYVVVTVENNRIK